MSSRASRPLIKKLVKGDDNKRCEVLWRGGSAASLRDSRAHRQRVDVRLDRRIAAQRLTEWQHIAEKAMRLEDAGQDRAAVEEWRKAEPA